MRQNVDVARFVSSLLPTAIEHNYVHRTLVAFYVGSMLDFVGKSKKLDDSILAFLLPAILVPLQADGKSNKELTVSRRHILQSSRTSRIVDPVPALVGHICPPFRPLSKMSTFFSSRQDRHHYHGVL